MLLRHLSPIVSICPQDLDGQGQMALGLTPLVTGTYPFDRLFLEVLKGAVSLCLKKKHTWRRRLWPPGRTIARR